MIKNALELIRKELDDYLHTIESLNLSPIETIVELGNISELEQMSNNSESTSNLDNKVVLSLINIEEEKTLKNGPTHIVVNSSVQNRNRPIFLNLYTLFTANFDLYENTLDYLSRTITFFQRKFVFDHQNSPTLDPGIEKLILDIHSVNFENLNHLWGILGGKYKPSVLYKMRLIIIQEAPQEVAPAIEAISNEENAI